MTIATNPWINWTVIAVEHEREARQARARWKSDPAFDGPSEESHASMVALAAAAFALEAWKNQIAYEMGVTAPREGNSHTRIVRFLQKAFDVDDRADTWISKMQWLFDEVRDALVHPVPSVSEGITHPAGGNMHPDNVKFSIESVKRATDLLFEVLETCAGRPREEHPAVVEYVAVGRNAHVFTWLVEKRNRPS